MGRGNSKRNVSTWLFVGNSMYVVLINDGCGWQDNTLRMGPPLGRGPGCIRKQAEQSKPVSSIPPWFLSASA